MNANPDQKTDAGRVTGNPARSASGTFKIPSVDPPSARNSWFNSYDEEWASFLASSSMMKKISPGINHDEAEALPRVWNTPHG